MLDSIYEFRSIFPLLGANFWKAENAEFSKMFIDIEKHKKQPNWLNSVVSEKQFPPFQYFPIWHFTAISHFHLPQSGFLDVVVPPDILNHPEQSLEENITNEGGTIILICSATGVPHPTVQWRREGGKDIILRTESREKQGTNQPSSTLPAVCELINWQLLSTTSGFHWITDLHVLLCL